MNCASKVTTTQHQCQGGLNVSKINVSISVKELFHTFHAWPIIRTQSLSIAVRQVQLFRNFSMFWNDYLYFTLTVPNACLPCKTQLSRKVEVGNPLNLRNLSKMRWTARAESIKSIWNSYEAILDSLARLEESGDGNALGLRTKLLRFNPIMFMKNAMYKTKRMTLALQSEDLNVIDAITIIESTVKSFNDNYRMNKENKVADLFAEKRGTDVESDFRRYHHQSKPPRRIEDNPNATANLSASSRTITKSLKPS